MPIDDAPDTHNDEQLNQRVSCLGLSDCGECEVRRVGTDTQGTLTPEDIRLLEDLAEEKDGDQAAAIRAYLQALEATE